MKEYATKYIKRQFVGDKRRMALAYIGNDEFNPNVMDIYYSQKEANEYITLDMAVECAVESYLQFMNEDFEVTNI